MQSTPGKARILVCVVLLFPTISPSFPDPPSPSPHSTSSSPLPLPHASRGFGEYVEECVDLGERVYHFRLEFVHSLRTDLRLVLELRHDVTSVQTAQPEVDV